MAGLLPDLKPIVENLNACQQRLEQVVARVEPSRWQEASGNPGWRYKDLLAHLATGDWVCQHLLRGLHETGRVLDWPDVDAGNAELISARGEKSVGELMEERAGHRRRTIELLSDLRPAHLEQPIELVFMGIGQVPFLRYLQGFAAHDIQHTWELAALAGE
ncbi:MAG: DinB family protein [Chloroflexi bacterium]|nr:DinB family protein [Chloroflexota bacterium]